MLSLFSRKKEAEESVVEEYQRLVLTGDIGSFLDIDTTLLISDRDEIENRLQNDKLDLAEREKVEQLDRIFQEKVRDDYRLILGRIRSGAKEKDYLIHVIKTIKDFGKEEPQSKWWFHMLDGFKEE